jgi:hypothetical protein
MTDDAGEVRRLLAPLRDRPVSVDPERLDAQRPRLISTLKLEMWALNAERRQRPWRRAAGVLLGFAAAASLVVGVRRFSSHRQPGAPASLTFVGSVGQTVARGAVSSRTLNAGDALSVDPGEIETAEAGSAELVNRAGLGLRLGGATRVSLAGLIDSTANQVELRQGVVTCSVPHLQEGQRFSVQTPDARVVVHGTVFSVHVDGKRASGAQTCVEVTDGVVIVQHDGSETALNAGDHWGCELAAGDAVAAAPVEPQREGEAAESRPALRGHARVVQHGTLSEETRLLQAALAAERVDQRGQAQALLNQLLTKYPSSPLAPEARRALSRLVVDVDGK